MMIVMMAMILVTLTSDDGQVNYKARLEHKRYLAQESPEPVRQISLSSSSTSSIIMKTGSQSSSPSSQVFDISECALKNVPAGIYSRCKVARKEALLLQVIIIINAFVTDTHQSSLCKTAWVHISTLW